MAQASSLEVFFPRDISFDSNKPVGGGGYGDLFKGDHKTKGTLALKRLRVRITPEDDPRSVKRAQNAYITEAELWRELRHPNIITCIGLLHNSWDDVYLVSPWMYNGSLVAFVACNPEVDRTQLLHDATQGLSYLHENDIIHGDVKGLNALVTADRRVALCDFGLSKFASSVSTSTGGTGTLRWQSPELLMGGPRTKEADVYAFGIMIYEILSGRIPFEQYQPATVAIAVAVRDERPPKDPQFSGMGESYAKVWGTAELCWTKAAEDRPSMIEVVGRWPSFDPHSSVLAPGDTVGRATAVDNPPSETPQHQRILRRAQAFYSRYMENHDMADLEAAIGFYREGLALNPSGHPERSGVLSSLGDALEARYEQQFDSLDLDEAIALQREAVQNFPLGDSRRASHLFKVGYYLNRRYVLTKEATDIGEAITFAREAVQLSPRDDSGYRIRVATLANYLRLHYDTSSSVWDLEESITLSREAMQLYSPEHTSRGIILENLSGVLEKRYEVDHETSDLKEAIQVCEEFIKASGAEHEYYSIVNERLWRLLKFRPAISSFKSKLNIKFRSLKL